MAKTMIYKAVFIVVLTVFSVFLILPTIGMKGMEIMLEPSVSKAEIDNIYSRFPSDKYTVEKKESTITIDGINITDALMNEIRTFPGVKNALIKPHWAEKAILAKKINLGLDLQGGMHLVMMADFEKIQEKINAEKNILDARRKELSGKPDSSGEIKDQIEDIDREIKDISENKIDDNGQLRDKYKTEITQQALELLRNRVDKFGVSEPSIRPRGNEAIEIQLPGVKDPKTVKKAIGTTGSVEYRLVNDVYTQKALQWMSLNYKHASLPETNELLHELALRISGAIKLPMDLEILFLFKRNPDSNKIYPADVMALERKVSLNGDDISKAWVGQDDYGGLTVQFRTTADGGEKFARVTSLANKGRLLAIIIDNKIRSAPRINEPIVGGNASITGDFTYDEVTALARIIQEGALPVDLTVAEERTVGPSLGQDSIESGIKAIQVGLIGVMFFMIVYYKMAGIISVFGLVLNSIFILAILSWLGFTLTMPGIAGFVLTIGMAVDANVIIYERIKEELSSGKSVRLAVSAGFDRAFWTIFDSNITTLIAAFVLSQYGTGPVKGFAVTLFVGIVSSMFVALYVTRFIYEAISSSGKIKKLSI